MDEEKRLFKRIVQSSADLYHAAECAEQILLRDLHSATAHEDKRLLRCLNTALIVSYARAFLKNKASCDVRKRLPTEYLDVLSDEQRQLHCHLIESRHQDHAHSDPKGMDMTVQVRKLGNSKFPVSISRDASAPWEKMSIEKVVELIRCLQAKLTQEQIRIHEILKDGECF